MKLETYFQETVAAGWAPRNPAGERELAGLASSVARGTCIEPLIYGGDVVYIDTNAKPEPGDLVSFALSQRGAEMQNTPPLTADHRPRSKGDRWVKLYGVYAGFEFLFDKYGNSATATLMACENPDHTPVLYPVRNIRRNGRLLFGPESSATPLIPRRAMLLGALAAPALAACDGGGGIDVPTLPPVNETNCEEVSCDTGQVGANAATSVLTTALSSAYTLPLSGAAANVLTLTVGPFAFAANVVITASGTWQIQAVTNPETIAELQEAISTGGSYGPDYNHVLNYAYVPIPAGQVQSAGFTDENTYALPTGSTMTVNLQLRISEVSTTVTKVSTATMKAEAIKR